MSDRQQFIMGLDLGQVNDPTAISVLEQFESGAEARFDLRHLERHLGQSYTRIVDRVKTLAARLAPQGELRTVFDQTGVGRAVADMLRDAQIAGALYGVTITSGESVSSDGLEFRVPKRDIVAALQVLFQNGRLRVAKDLPLAELLVRELLNFKVKTTAAANETFEAWRSGDHDDFVLATGIACWLEVAQKSNTGLLLWMRQRIDELEGPGTSNRLRATLAMERETVERGRRARGEIA